MSKAIENLEAAQERAMKGRPNTHGFPYLAETLRRAGVKSNVWFLPACESLYLTDKGPVIVQGTPLFLGAADVPGFNQDALTRALQADQTGESTFQEFLMASWQAGVIRYDVDLIARTVTYYGCCNESYVETYPAVRTQLP